MGEGRREVFLGVSICINVLVPTSSTRVKCTRRSSNLHQANARIPKNDQHSGICLGEEQI